MKQASTVSFHIDAADSETIAAILAVISGGTASTKFTTKATTTKAKTKETPDDSEAPTMAEVKKAMMAAKKEHGEDFVIDVLTDVGETEKPDATVARQLAACDAENYPAMLVAFAEGPKEEKKDSDDELEADGVVEACKAYAKENSRKELKELLKPLGVKVSEIADADQKTLRKVMKAVI